MVVCLFELEAIQASLSTDASSDLVMFSRTTVPAEAVRGDCLIHRRSALARQTRSREPFHGSLHARGQGPRGSDRRRLGGDLDRVPDEHADRPARCELTRGDQPYRDEWDPMRERKPGSAAVPDAIASRLRGPAREHAERLTLREQGAR